MFITNSTGHAINFNGVILYPSPVVNELSDADYKTVTESALYKMFANSDQMTESKKNPSEADVSKAKVKADATAAQNDPSNPPLVDPNAVLGG